MVSKDDELLGMMKIVRDGDIRADSFSEGKDFIRYAYELELEDVRLKLVVDEFNDGKKIFDLYSDRNFVDYISAHSPKLPSRQGNNTADNIKSSLNTDDNPQYSLKSPLESLKSAQGRIDGLRSFAKYLANPPAHLRGDAQRLRADVSAMRELDMHTRQALTDKANAIDSLAYQNGYPEPQYSLKNPRQKQKFAEDSVGILQQIRAKSREGMEKILNNSWVNSALGTRIYGRNFEDYRHIKDVFDKDIAENASKALDLHNKLKLLSEDAQRKMHHYMNGDTNGEDLSSELKTLADSFRKEVRKETDELVKLGLLDKKTAEKWGDVYLLREYSTRMVDRIKRGLRGLKSEDYGIGLDTIHMRGKKQKVGEAQYQEMLQKGEIGDITKGKWEVLQKPSKHEPHYILRRDYTRAEREAKGEIDLISYSLPRTLAKIANQKRIATLFSAISKESDLAQKLEAGKEIPSGFRRLNGEQYGALKGFVVRNEVADDIERTTNKILGESKEILKQIAGFATYWKKTKTVHNPTSHINNMIGNVFFLGMEGNIKGIANAFAAVKNGLPQNIARYEELCAKRGIVNLTQSEASELARLDTADMRLYKTLKDRGVFDKSSLNMVLNDYLRESGVVPQQSKATNAALGAFMKLDSKLSRIYGAEDHIFRFGSVKSLFEAGHSLNEAIDITNKVIPDYSKPMPKWLDNAARYGVLPFVQFTYHATPIMLRQLNPLAKSAKGEWNKKIAAIKLGTMAGLFGAYQGLVEYFADGEMPQGFNAKELPVWRYRNGDVQTVRIGAAVPHLALADWLPFSSKNGILPENIRTTAIGGIPQWGYYATTDKNAYYDRPITSRKDGWRHYDRGKYIAQQFLPEWFNKGYNLAEVGWKDEQKRKRSNVLNERSGFESALGLAGINTKSYNLHQLRLENERKKQLQSLQ